MPTENRRVAAYLPKNIDKQLEIFKTERGLKGDSSAIIVILEAFFGVSQEVACLSDSGTTNFAQRIKVVEQRLSQIKDELLSELRNELKNYLYSELKSELECELLEAESESELNSEFPGEVSQPTQQTRLAEVSESEQVSESSSKLLSELEIAQVESDSLPDTSVSEPPPNLLSESPIKPISGILLAKRLNCHSDNLSKTKSKLSEEDFYQWSKSKDFDGIAWKFLKKGRKYLPVSELPDKLLSKLLSWIEQNDVRASHSEAVLTAKIDSLANE